MEAQQRLDLNSFDSVDEVIERISTRFPRRFKATVKNLAGAYDERCFLLGASKTPVRVAFKAWGNEAISYYEEPRTEEGVSWYLVSRFGKPEIEIVRVPT